MGKVERLNRLETLFQWVGGSITGRKKLHKLIYLSQALGFDLWQEFIFHFYGVYSPSLSKDLEMAKAWGLLEEDKTGGRYCYNLIEEKAPGERWDEEIESIVVNLEQQPAAVLEVLSTIVFLDKSGYGEIQVERKLEELKGHLRSHFAKARQLAVDYFNYRSN